MNRQRLSPTYRRFLKEAKAMEVAPIVASADIKEEKRIYIADVMPKNKDVVRPLTLVTAKPPKAREHKGKYKNPLRFSLPPELWK